jgi:hypothetical protein
MFLSTPGAKNFLLEIDFSGAICFSTISVFYARTKYIESDFYFVRHLVKKKKKQLKVQF